jgi:hypothetical protein
VKLSQDAQKIPASGRLPILIGSRLQRDLPDGTFVPYQPLFSLKPMLTAVRPCERRFHDGTVSLHPSRSGRVAIQHDGYCLN